MAMVAIPETIMMLQLNTVLREASASDYVKIIDGDTTYVVSAAHNDELVDVVKKHATCKIIGICDNDGNVIKPTPHIVPIAIC